MRARSSIRITGWAVSLVMLWVMTLHAQTLREEAAAAYQHAQAAEIALKERPAGERTRAEYLRVIRQYERVYLITPHTGYADDALLNIAALYEEIDDPGDAMRTLQFLVREYPASRFISNARADLERLTTPSSPAPEVAELAPDETDTSVASDEVPVAIENIRYWESPKSVRVVVDMAGEATYTQGDARNPPRVFVDIHGARLGPALGQREFPVESVMLHHVRVGQNDPDTVRVVLDLVQLHDATIFELRNPDRLVIDVVGDAPEAGRPVTPAVTDANTPKPTGAVEETAASGASRERPPEDVPAEVTVSPIGKPASPTASGDQSLIRSLGLKVGRVVIDPGHGGHDSGTIGPSGLTEKELVLDLSLRLKERIEVEIGAEVVLTRDNDSFVPLETRTAIANQAEADLFLSIHANSSQIGSIRGFETYILNLATSNADLEIAARENAASQASISELQDLVRKITLQTNVDESRELASHIQQALAAREEFGRDRGIKQAPFVVLIGANMPSILAEVSFLSNPDDERLLRSDEGRRAIVEALFDGVRSYSDTLGGFRTAQVRQ